MTVWLTGMYCKEPIFRHDWLFDMNRTTKEDNVEIAEKAKIDRPSFLSRALAFSFIDNFWFSLIEKIPGMPHDSMISNETWNRRIFRSCFFGFCGVRKSKNALIIFLAHLLCDRPLLEKNPRIRPGLLQVIGNEFESDPVKLTVTQSVSYSVSRSIISL